LEGDLLVGAWFICYGVDITKDILFNELIKKGFSALIMLEMLKAYSLDL
jgi:hypothetical protein